MSDEDEMGLVSTLRWGVELATRFISTIPDAGDGGPFFCRRFCEQRA